MPQSLLPCDLFDGQESVKWEQIIKLEVLICCCWSFFLLFLGVVEGGILEFQTTENNYTCKHGAGGGGGGVVGGVFLCFEDWFFKYTSRLLWKYDAL